MGNHSWLFPKDTITLLRVFAKEQSEPSWTLLTRRTFEALGQKATYFKVTFFLVYVVHMCVCTLTHMYVRRSEMNDQCLPIKPIGCTDWPDQLPIKALESVSTPKGWG